MTSHPVTPLLALPLPRHMALLSMPFCQTPAHCSFQMIHIYFSRELPLEQLQVSARAPASGFSEDLFFEDLLV